MPQHPLEGYRVLIVHENAFQADYLCDVLARNGAVIAGGMCDPTTCLALLRADPPPGALVLSLSFPAEHGAALKHAAMERGVATLIVKGPRDVRVLADAGGVVEAPYAGFQVVDALVRLLSHGHGDASAAGTHPCGHRR